MFAATVFAATVRCCGVGCAVGRSIARCRRVGTVVVARASWGWAMSPVGRIRASAAVLTGAVVASAAEVPSTSAAAETMLAPTVAVSPVRPWTYSEENAVIEIARPVKAARRAAVR